MEDTNNKMKITNNTIDENGKYQVINRNKTLDEDNGKIIKISINTDGVDLNKLFTNCEGIKSLTITKFCDKSIISLAKFFSGCKNATTFNLLNMETKNCQNMDLYV